MSTRLGNCIKTGARVLFAEYGFMVPADIFQVGDCFVLRTNPETRNYAPELVARCTHEVTIGNIGFFHEAAGVAVVPKNLLRVIEKPLAPQGESR